MESCSNQIKIHVIFEILHIATLCLDGSFAHAWHSLNQLHLECFSNSHEGVPTYAEHLLDAFPSLCGPTHPKPSQFSWGRGNVEARSSDALTLLLGKIALTQPGCVLGHCPLLPNRAILSQHHWLAQRHKEGKKCHKLNVKKAHLLIEMHSRWLPHEAGWENAKSVQSCHQGVTV